ncbi:MAG: ABC transporter ATP-binding protein [Methanobacteriota archaeon]|nr:MAG: ABC transporter ATP-binding protein [Euryarchaeota archaeon]
MISDDVHPLLKLLRYGEKYRIDILLATLYSILNKLFDLAPPLLIGVAVDVVVRREGSIIGELGVSDLVDQLIVLAVMTFLIWGLESVFEFAYKVKWRNLAQAIQNDLRLDTYRHVQDLELAFFEDNNTGALMAIINNDVNQLERFLDVGANDIIQVTTTAIAISLMFYGINIPLAVIASIPMPIILFFSIKYQQKLEERYRDVREKVGIINAELSNNLSGIMTIKSFGTEEYEARRIAAASKEYEISNRRAIILSSSFSPLIRIIIVAGFIGMLIVGGIETLNGNIEIAAYSVAIFLIQRLLWPLTRLGETFDLYQRSMASTNRIFSLLNREKRLIDGNIPLAKEDVNGEIVFEDVDFDYPSRPNILRSVSFKIHPGETVAFVGTTGAGKSTIVKLMLRFYDPVRGTIWLDGHDLRELKLKDLRAAIGFVSQNTFLVDGTIRENIAYGKLNATDEEIMEAAKIAEIHDFVMSLPQKYDTLVGERGHKLSGGQRQRIAIARAVLKDPPILILDEATSSVDNETEAAIQRSLERIIVGRTTVMIAHRLSTIRNADIIYVLENGRIIEKGRHEDLLEMNGAYAALWRVQTGERIKPV